MWSFSNEYVYGILLDIESDLLFAFYMSQCMRFLSMWYVLPLECSIIVKLLTEPHLEFLSLKGGYRGLSESTLVKMPHYWKSNVTAHIYFLSFW